MERAVHRCRLLADRGSKAYTMHCSRASSLIAGKIPEQKHKEPRLTDYPANKKPMRPAIDLLKSVFVLLCIFSYQPGVAQKKTFVFDLSHGRNGRIAQGWKEILLDSTLYTLGTSEDQLDADALAGKDVLILFSPNTPFEPTEKEAIQAYLQEGGSLLLMFDEERRTPMSVGINDIISPFGIELTENAAARHNCGAIAEKSIVCADRRELPYSGGRSIKGGTVISKVNDEGDYVHAAYVNLDGGGKLVVFSDAMAALLLGGPDGIRFSGTGPNDSKYWGKDSEVFMKEIIAFVAN